jgi:3-oxoacyl-[acyl-carrier-protein] synthase III
MSDQIFMTTPERYLAVSPMSIEDLAKAERFVSDVEKLTTHENYRSVGVVAGHTLTQMAIEVGRAALSAAQLRGEDVGLVLFSHHWEDEEWHLLQPFRMHHALGLRGAAEVLEVRTGNAGSMTRAIGLASQLLKADAGLGNVLVVGSDKVNRRVMRRRFGNQVFGDAAAAVVIGLRPAAYRLLDVTTVPVSSRYHNLEEFNGRVEAAWIDELQRTVSETFGQFLGAQKLTREDIGAVVVPNLGPVLFSRLVAATGIEAERFHMSSRPLIAHAVTCDAFFNLALAAESGAMEDRPVVLISAGLGGSFHIVLLNPNRTTEPRS